MEDDGWMREIAHQLALFLSLHLFKHVIQAVCARVCVHTLRTHNPTSPCPPPPWISLIILSLPSAGSLSIVLLHEVLPDRNRNTKDGRSASLSLTLSLAQLSGLCDAAELLAPPPSGETVVPHSWEDKRRGCWEGLGWAVWEGVACWWGRGRQSILILHHWYTQWGVCSLHNMHTHNLIVAHTLVTTDIHIQTSADFSPAETLDQWTPSTGSWFSDIRFDHQMGGVSHS